ncbi:MAG: integron integrase [Acidobacteria bacterium]|nr:integron integrase [Acidobacteriota bacterium]
MGDPPRLLDRVRHAIRARHYSRRTEEAYLVWIRRYIVYHRKVHPAELGADAIATFLTWLAVDRKVSASTQNQALSALLFLYREVLRMDPGPIEHVPRAKSAGHVPVVLSVAEVRAVMGHLTGIPWLVVGLLYGADLRLPECLELRVKDIDFDRGEIVVRRGKGQKDRRTMLPELVRERLRLHLDEVRRLHEGDIRRGCGRVVLPAALERKYPNAATEWRWQFVFPAGRICRAARFGPPSRYHLRESVVQKALRQAGRRAGITKRLGPHVMRHCFGTHLLEDGYDIRTVQELLGHRDVRTTMMYVHVMHRGALGVKSPMDRL